VSYERTDQESIGSKWLDWPFIVISGVILMWATQPWQVLLPKDAILLFGNVLAVVALLWWADQYEREPLRTVAWAFLWGAFPAALLSVALEYEWPTLFGGVIIEEGVKLVGLLMIYRRGSIQSWSDGLVMGGFIGLGFATIEDLIYAINGNDAFATLISRGIFSIFAHTFFSGLGATIIVFGLLTRRWWISAIGFLVAIFLHLTWNTILAFELFSYKSAGFFFFYSFLPPIILTVTSLLLRKQERHLLAVRGYVAIQAGYFDEIRLQQIVSLRERRSFFREFPTREEKKRARAQIYDDARKLLTESYSVRAEEEQNYFKF
jgi:RsiW-degrading membrane proteinase PrsW (M82 family)